MRETATINLPRAIRRELDRIAKEKGVSAATFSGSHWKASYSCADFDS
jgi:hypothetical protein